MKIEWIIFTLVSLCGLGNLQAQVSRSPLPVERRSENIRARISLYTTVKAKKDSQGQQPGETLRVRDIARVYSNDMLLRGTIEELDLDSWPAAGKIQEIKKSHISLRLELSDIDPNSVAIIGNPEVKVINTNHKNAQTGLLVDSDKSLRDKLALAIRNQIGRQFGLSKGETVVANLEKKIELDANRSEIDPDNCEIQIVSDGDLLIGTRKIEFLLIDSGQFVKGSVMTSIVVGKNISVATQHIKRGDVLSTRNVASQKIFFKSSRIEQVTGVEALGQFASRDIRPGSQIRSSDLITTDRRKNEYIVKKGSLVMATIKRGDVKMNLANAICIQQGRLGESILVQNPTTKKTFVARVVSSDRVELN